MAWRGWLGALVAAVLVLGWVARDRAATPSRIEASSTAPAAVAASPTVTATETPSPPTRARSLRGTDVDGDLEHDGDGRFIVTRRALRLFDYFLTATGEQDATAIRAQVAEVARQRLGAAEAERAIALYDRYVDYRAALPAAFAGAPPGAGLHTALALVEAAQVAFFGRDDAERLFATDDALAAATLDRAAAAR
jgi:lipase chaperone LimK